MDFKEELAKLPESPGVYMMYGENDEVIYVGKAVKLRNRVRQYFQSGGNESAKILSMVKKIRRFETILTDSESEALVLECNLIKEYRPYYNTMLKDDKSYPYVKVTVHEDFPRALFSRDKKHGKDRYFGPYTSAGAIKDVIKLINQIFGLRTCSRRLPQDTGKERPCLNYYIGRCPAPCQGYITEEDYAEHVEKAMAFLAGRYGQVLDDLRAKMSAAAEKLEFEEAARYRELIREVQEMEMRQKLLSEDQENRDIIAYAGDGREGVVQVFFIREGKMIGRDHFRLTIADGDSRSRILSDFVKQFYAGTPFVPREILLPLEIEDAECIAAWLSEKKGQKVYLITPKKGEKRGLLDLAEENARALFTQDQERVKREEIRTVGAQRELAELLDLPGLHRIEAYDISNISGYDSVGSMVVYEDGKPKKNDYRKFRIRGVTGANDYDSLREVLTRRLTHGLSESGTGFARLPDLIFMDGGLGQVGVALEVLDEFHLAIPVCGMVKDDRHRTSDLIFEGEAIRLDHHSQAFRLVERIQDEAHRFAITYHRDLRSKGQTHSLLDDIPGIGPARRKALMGAFSSLEEMKNASTEELAAIPGMNSAAAASVRRFFHSEES